MKWVFGAAFLATFAIYGLIAGWFKATGVSGCAITGTWLYRRLLGEGDAVD